LLHDCCYQGKCFAWKSERSLVFSQS